MEEGKVPTFTTPAAVQEKRVQEVALESEGVANPDDIDFGDMSKDEA